MRRYWFWPISSLLLGAYPVIYLYSANLGSVPASAIFVPLLLTLTVALVLTGICRLWLGNWTRAALVIDVLLFSIYLWTSGIDILCPWIYGTPLSKIVVLILMALSLILARIIGHRLRAIADLRPWAQMANLSTALLLVIPLSQIMWYHFTAPPTPQQITLPEKKASDFAWPDVYYIILDGYTRADILAKEFKFDNSPFINFLRQKGFYVATKSRSNYAYTYLSLSSTLNMNYIGELDGAENQQLECIRRILEDSVTRIFRINGYRVLRFSPFWVPPTQDAYTGTTFNPREVNEFQNLILKRYMLRPFIKQGVLNMYKTRVYYTLQRLEMIAKEKRHAPTFVFAHLLCPHPPYVFDREGHSPEPRAYLSKPLGSHDWYPKDRYADQVYYLNHLVENTIERILARSAHPPIIIIQGDHGAASDGTSATPSPLMIRERMGILNAYYVPARLKQKLYPTISPVNSFRLLFNFLFQSQFGRLDDRSYYSGPMDVTPYRFMDVTSAGN